MLKMEAYQEENKYNTIKRHFPKMTLTNLNTLKVFDSTNKGNLIVI